MKECPSCRQVYADETLNFCLADGTALSRVGPQGEETVILPARVTSDADRPKRHGVSPLFAYLSVGLIALIGGAAAMYLLRGNGEAAVQPDTISKITNTRTAEPAPNIPTNANARPAPKQPDTTFEYSTRNIRAGTADGKRLRVVVDLGRTETNAGTPVRHETLASGGTAGEARVLVHADASPNLNVNYESKAARGLGTLYLVSAESGFEVKVVPKSMLFLKDVFFLPRSSANPNDRLVIDLCIQENCPSLKP